jgi:hypothetical protein
LRLSRGRPCGGAYATTWKATPVIASRIGGIQDQIVDGEAELLVDDPTDLDTVAADISPDAEYVPIGAVPGIRDALPGPEGYKRILAWLRDAFDDAHADRSN